MPVHPNLTPYNTAHHHSGTRVDHWYQEKLWDQGNSDADTLVSQDEDQTGSKAKEKRGFLLKFFGFLGRNHERAKAGGKAIRNGCTSSRKALKRGVETILWANTGKRDWKVKVSGQVRSCKRLPM